MSKVKLGYSNVGNFTFHVSPAELLPPSAGEYFLVSIFERKDSFSYYVSLTKDPRFSNFNPLKHGDKVEKVWYEESKNQQQPMWKLHLNSLRELVNLCAIVSSMG